MSRQTGTVYWLTGFSGAGKTTIGKRLYQSIKQKKSNVIFLDGDILREVYGNDLGHTREERYQVAMRNARLCHMISEQNIDVVCCTISMFDRVREWNRNHIANYMEIYLEVPIEVLHKRDQKGLYMSVKKGEEQNLVGVDLHLELPKNPHLVIHNDGKETPEEIVRRILQ